MIYAIDISNHQGVPSVPTMRRWREQGYEHLIVRLSLERASMIDIARAQLENGAEAGFTLAGYPWAYPRVEDPHSLAPRILEAYGAELLCYWIDFEDEEGWAFEDPNRNITWASEALKTFDAAGVRVGVYSGAWWWNKPNRMAGTPAFRNYPLWEAYYVKYVPDAPGMATFGGWDARRAWQYTDKGLVAGSTLDLSVVDDVWLYSKPEVPVTDEQMAEVQRIAQDEIIRNVESATDHVDAALKYGRLSAGARESLKLARENLQAGALPAAQTLARGEV
jgi:GH25 family lysozyme M1 (1,4-beta-N-acetylmuramidase)